MSTKCSWLVRQPYKVSLSCDQSAGSLFHEFTTHPSLSLFVVGTCHWKEGPTCFDRIADELRDLMRKKGYSSLSDCKGKLKPWTKEGAAISRQAAKEDKIKDVVGVPTARSTKSGEAQFYRMLSAILAVLLAIVFTNKFADVKLLPSE
jgi:hypothetical protein